MMMEKEIFKIGITGSAGSGKSRVCHRLAEHGVPVISCDLLARQVVAPGTPGLAALKARFGAGILDAGGALDRRALREMIAGDAGCRRAVEAIVQPAILHALFREMGDAAQKGHPMVAAEVPLLFELKLADRFHRVVVVRADSRQLVTRIARRDGVSLAAASALLELQMSQQEKAAMAHVVIENNGTLETLDHQVDRFYFGLKDAFS